MCRRDPVYWINRWAWTFDPRKNAVYPFELFPRQEEFVRWLQDRDEKQEGGLAEKSRDVGFTWICTAYATHKWLFGNNDVTGFGSRKLDLVDKTDDPDCIFEKIRFGIRHMESWMLPAGFSWQKHSKEAILVNPVNNCTIRGEGGTEIGRGGRCARYFVDEAAFLPNPRSVDASLSQTTEVRIDISTPNGMGNSFYKKRFNGTTPVFTFHWRDDPRKDGEWYRRKCDELQNDPVIIAQELDIDYTASIEGVVIPAKYVQAAVDFDITEEGIKKAGWDVAGEGDNSNVLITRVGNVVKEVKSWSNMDTFQSTHNATLLCNELDVRTLNYDASGLGAGPKGAFNAMAKAPEFAVRPVTVGEPATESLWADGKSSREKFGNLRAELWWRLRERFRKTYERKLEEEGRIGGHYWPDDECISIPNHGDLIAQLSMPLGLTRDTGKYFIESKKDMKKRGVKSPDFADALALSEASPAGSWAQLESDAVHAANPSTTSDTKKYHDCPAALDLDKDFQEHYGGDLNRYSGW